MVEVRNHIVLICIASVPLPKSSKHCVFGVGFRENIIFGFILRVVAGSKSIRGRVSKESTFSMDLRSLFLNASPESGSVKVNQILLNSFSGPEFKAMDSTLQGSCFCGLERTSIQSHKCSRDTGQPPWRSMLSAGELVNIMERQEQTHPFYWGRTHIKLQEPLQCHGLFPSYGGEEGGQRGKCCFWEVCM